MNLQWHPGTMPELDSDTAKADCCERQPALKIFQDTLWKGKKSSQDINNVHYFHRV
jgi:hypothetical protein